MLTKRVADYLNKLCKAEIFKAGMAVQKANGILFTEYYYLLVYVGRSGNTIECNEW